MENFDGIDLDSARRVAGNGFYNLMGDIARLHSAVISYARDFMINRGFTYCVPPFMIRSNVVTGVMSFAEMDAMMYKIEGEDLYLIGTSEHSMIGKFIDQIVPEEELPKTLTSYSPCFRKEKGAHGLEERGVYRIHQFEKQEMIVVCKPEESPMWFEKLWQNTVDLFRSLDIPVRTLECDQHSRRSYYGVVQCMCKIFLTIFSIYTDSQTTCLCITKVGAASYFEVFLLSWRPCFYIEGFYFKV